MLSSALLLAILAGILNGSYAAPFKLISWSAESIWLLFSLLAFGLMPWLASFLIDHHSILLLSHLPKQLLLLLSICGVLFALGMILFTYSLRYVGIAVSFMLNIAAGTIIGSLLPLALLNTQKLLSTVGQLEIVALLFFLLGLILTTQAAKWRDRDLATEHVYKGHYFAGIFLGILSGLLCSSQGFAYSYSLPAIKLIAQHMHLAPLAVANFPWCLIFNAALIPYFIYFLLQWIKKRQQNKAQRKIKPAWQNLLLLLIMVGCYYGSLLLFSQSGLLLGSLGSIIAWPLFMTIIVLVSNTWGFIQKEWQQAGLSAKVLNSTGIFALIIAIILLGFDGYLNLHS